MYDSQISFVQEYHHCLLCLCFAPFCLACALLRFAFFCRTGASCERQGRPVLGCQRSHATRLKSTARHVTRLDFTGRRPAKSDWLSPACAIGKTYRFPLDREERDSIRQRIQFCSTDSFEYRMVCATALSSHSLAYSLARVFTRNTTNTTIARRGHAVILSVVRGVGN